MNTLKDILSNCKGIVEEYLPLRELSVMTRLNKDYNLIFSNSLQKRLGVNYPLIEPLGKLKEEFMKSYQVNIEDMNNNACLLKERVLELVELRNRSKDQKKLHITEHFIDYLVSNSKKETLKLLLDWVEEYSFLFHLSNKNQQKKEHIQKPTSFVYATLYDSVTRYRCPESIRLKDIESKINEQLCQYFDYVIADSTLMAKIAGEGQYPNDRKVKKRRLV